MTRQSGCVKRNFTMSEEKIILPIRVAPETRRQLKIHAAVHSTSVNALLNRAIDELLKSDDQTQPLREPVAA
jgi:hypothetical protein